MSKVHEIAAQWVELYRGDHSAALLGYIASAEAMIADLVRTGYYRNGAPGEPRMAMRPAHIPLDIPEPDGDRE